MSLVLGTVQLGMAYGVANATGRPDEANARAIVAAALEGGVRDFDTAPGYGDAEAVLGRALAASGMSAEARVFSKVGGEAADAAAIERSVRDSLTRLGVSRLAGLLLHREDMLDQWDKGLGAALADLSAGGLVERLGVSVYSPARALQALQVEGVGLVQLPANLLDDRFERAGVLDLARKRGILVHVRSVFLQGLFFLPPSTAEARAPGSGELVRRVRALADRYGLSVHGLALGFVREACPNAGVLFGAETVAQVRENLDAWSAPLPARAVADARSEFHGTPERIVNPTMWDQGRRSA